MSVNNRKIWNEEGIGGKEGETETDIYIYLMKLSGYRMKKVIMSAPWNVLDLAGD